MDDENPIDSAVERLMKALTDEAEKIKKGRRYVNDPSEAPENVNIEQGPQGGYYYEVGDADPADPSMEGGAPGEEVDTDSEFSVDNPNEVLQEFDIDPEGYVSDFKRDYFEATRSYASDEILQEALFDHVVLQLQEEDISDEVVEATANAAVEEVFTEEEQPSDNGESDNAESDNQGEDSESIAGWGGTRDWDRNVQDRAENVGQDYIDDAHSGGAYQSLTPEEVGQRAFESARRQAVNMEGVDAEEFAEEVAAMVETEVEDIRMNNGKSTNPIDNAVNRMLEDE